MRIDQFHFEHEEAVTRNLRATAVRTVSEVARDPCSHLATDLHELEHFGPARNHGVNREFERLATVDRAVELGAVEERTRVVHLDDIGIARGGTGTFGNHLVLEAAFRGDNTFGGLVRSEECFAGSLIGFGSDAILLDLFGLTVGRKLLESFENGGIVHQERSRILVVAFLESLDEQIDIQIDGITGDQLEMGLGTEMGTEGVAVLFLVRYQVLLDGRALAELIATSHEHGDNASSDYHFRFHR